MSASDVSMPEDLAELAAQFHLGKLLNAERLDNGLINTSYKVESERGLFVLQRLSSLWDERVIDDYCAVQRYLRTHGLFVPVLLQTRTGQFHVKNSEGLWRAFEYVPHEHVETPTPALAYEAGTLLGRFHALMSRSSFSPTFTLPGFHDTPSLLTKLNTTMHAPHYAKKAAAVRQEYALIANIIEHHYLPADTQRVVIHGDPKLNNFLFRNEQAIALLDLDTMMLGSPLLDIGDALRSWCRRKPATSEFMPAIFDAALKGYRAQSCFEISQREAKHAMGLLTLELAARYLLDYFEESYFPLKAEKYATRAEQNLARCRRYLDYYKNFTGDVKENHLLCWGLEHRA